MELETPTERTDTDCYRYHAREERKLMQDHLQSATRIGPCRRMTLAELQSEGLRPSTLDEIDYHRSVLDSGATFSRPPTDEAKPFFEAATVARLFLVFASALVIGGLVAFVLNYLAILAG